MLIWLVYKIGSYLKENTMYFKIDYTNDVYNIRLFILKTNWN
jgi:hypothetical protein